MAGRAFRSLREFHQITQVEMARRAGISKSHLARIESGERSAGADLTERLCEIIAELPAPGSAA